jgi:protein O-mannosyl-transferase
MENRAWKTVLRDAALQPAFLCLVLAVTTLVIFWPVTRCDFTNYDDPGYYSENSHVLAGLSWANVKWAFCVSDDPSLYPVTWLSYLLDATLFGKGPRGPHLTNLLLHTANVLLIFLLLRRLTGAQWKSAFVAALFAMHPLRVETVAWIAERKGVLSTFFGLLALWAYARYVERSKAKSPKSKVWYGLALVGFALGLMSKPMLVTLPFAMLLLDYWPLQRFSPATANYRRSTLRRLFLEKTPFFALGALSSAVTVWVHNQFGAIAALTFLPIQDRIANSLVSYGRYLGKMFWPAHLALPYPHPGQWPLGWVVLATALVCGLSLAAVGLARRRPYVFVGWFWFAGMLVPVIGVVQWGLHAMADRFTYVPLIGLFIIVAWAIGEVVETGRASKWLAGGVAALVLGACTIRTGLQLQHWKDSESLFRHTLEVTGDNLTALNNLGAWLTVQKRPSEAIVFLHHALQMNPGNVDTLYNLGNALAEQGRFAEAVTNFQAAVALKPEHYQARNNLAKAWTRLGRFSEAIEQYRLALQRKPDDPMLYKNLAETLGASGNFDEMIAQYQVALALQPADAGTHYALGIALAMRGKWEEAIQHYTATLRLTPDNPEAHYNLGYALEVQGRLEQAAMHLQEALRLRPEFPVAHYNLACVLAKQGQRNEAVVHLKEALRLKPDYKQARQELLGLGDTSGPEG